MAVLIAGLLDCLAVWGPGCLVAWLLGCCLLTRKGLLFPRENGRLAACLLGFFSANPDLTSGIFICIVVDCKQIKVTSNKHRKPNTSGGKPEHM